jgi:hypothetical protein
MRICVYPQLSLPLAQDTISPSGHDDDVLYRGMEHTRNATPFARQKHEMHAKCTFKYR